MPSCRISVAILVLTLTSGLKSTVDAGEPIELIKATQQQTDSKDGQLPPDLQSEADELRGWKFIVLHHSATENGSVEGIDAAHKQRVDSNGNPWRGIGYHFVIGNGNGMEDGEIQPTFRWHDQSDGAHAGAAQYNQLGIGICLIGNFEEQPPTKAQLAAIKRVVAEFKREFVMEQSQVIRHGDIKSTACPGRLFPFEEVAKVKPIESVVTPKKPAGGR